MVTSDRQKARCRVLLMASSMRGGGSERQTVSLLRHLDRERFEPHLYLTHRDGDLLTELPSDVPVHPWDDLPPSAGFYFPGRILRRQIAHLRGVIAEASIDVVYDRTFHMTLLAAPAARGLGVRRVATIVSPPEQMVPTIERRFRWLKKRRLARGYRDAAQVIAVSDLAARSARRYYRLPAGKVEVIPNPVDLARLRAVAESSPPPPRDERPTLVCVGRMTEEKGHRDLLDAIAMTESRWPESVAPMRVWLIGDGPLRGELESLRNAVPRRHEVRFLGASANPAPAIAAADALVLPSRFEGMPNVVLEAMALDTPVIATRAGGTVELQRESPTAFWAEPNRPDTLADAILHFVTSPDQAAAHAHAAKTLVMRHHDVDKTTRKIEQRLLASDPLELASLPSADGATRDKR